MMLSEPTSMPTLLISLFFGYEYYVQIKNNIENDK